MNHQLRPAISGEASEKPGSTMLRITQTRGTIATLHLLLGRLLHDLRELKALSRGRDYRVSLGAVQLVVVPRTRMVHVQTGQYLYLVSLVQAAVLAPVEHLAEWHVPLEKNRVAGTAEEVSLGEEGT